MVDLEKGFLVMLILDDDQLESPTHKLQLISQSAIATIGQTSG